MMAFILSALFASIRLVSILRVSGPMSTKAGVTPIRTVTSAVDIMLNEVVIDSSPSLTPNDIMPISDWHYGQNKTHFP